VPRQSFAQLLCLPETQARRINYEHDKPDHTVVPEAHLPSLAQYPFDDIILCSHPFMGAADGQGRKGNRQIKGAGRYP
jgi:hypothetical protein